MSANVLSLIPVSVRRLTATVYEGRQYWEVLKQIRDDRLTGKLEIDFCQGREGSVRWTSTEHQKI